MSESDNAVELRNVVKRFGNFTAVDHIDLTIRAGEFFTLLGASGCGKTTTLNLIAGFDLPTEGQVLIAGQEVSGVPAYQRPVHTVFQSYSLFPHLTILENVAFPLKVRRLSRTDRRDRAMAALEMVQMANFADRKPSQLSGGQQQRVALARALVNEPKVLLLDEPLGALDLKLRKEMQFELKTMQRRLGITFVFVTHDQEEALTMSDRIALMQSGRIVQLSDPATLYDAPQSLYAAEFIGETNLMKAHVADLDSRNLIVEIAGQRLRLARTSETPPTGTKVTLAVRPERIIPGKDNTGPNRIQGVLREMAFIGTDLRLVYETANQTSLTVRVQNCGGQLPEIGQTAHLHIPGDAVRVFTE